MRTVRDFTQFCLQAVGLPEHGYIEFGQISEDHHIFMVELCRLGSKKATKKATECEDIDATAFLTDQEWTELEDSFNALQVR